MLDYVENSDEIRVGSQVAYHLPKAKQADAEWIQCNVIRITGEAPKFRYEVQDPEPDEHGNMSQTYKTYSNNLILIPDDSSGLPQLPNGTMVLARYPETTTFYRAEVIATKVCPTNIKADCSEMAPANCALKGRKRLEKRQMWREGLCWKFNFIRIRIPLELSFECKYVSAASHPVIVLIGSINYHERSEQTFTLISNLCMISFA